jgi:disulfide bond formation protein DsbB
MRVDHPFRPSFNIAPERRPRKIPESTVSDQAMTEAQDLPAATDDPEAASASLLERYGLHLALLVAWIATLGSLFFSDVMGFLPCPLCWYQRICMYPLAVILPIGILRRDRGVAVYVLALALIGISISIYHLGIERGFIQETTACKVGVSCAVRYINWFGFITIPLLAFTAFAIILLATSAFWRGGLPPASDSAPRPWAAVLGIIVGVCLVFAALTWWFRAPAAAHAGAANAPIISQIIC